MASEAPLVLDSDHAQLLQACSDGSHSQVQTLFLTATAADPSGLTSRLLAAQQDPTTGKSPLMVASTSGHFSICETLLEMGAPWNALDCYGKCAGNYATENEHWDIVNLLVDYGTRAELILGASIRLNRQKKGQDEEPSAEISNDTSTIVSHQPSTKPDYLTQANVRYNAANTLILDDDDDAIMMEWERPLMEAHASFIVGESERKRILNVGFGLGIIDTAIQSYNPSLHVIIEAHPTVYNKMLTDGWDKKENVRICFGRWQDELPKLLNENCMFDGIFYDTYGEHFTDLEDFHELMAILLDKPNGVYSFFNGLAPDNLFFHGVACNCIKIQLSSLGLNTDFLSCNIQVDEKEWEGVRRRYWHGRETYYLPVVRWENSLHDE